MAELIFRHVWPTIDPDEETDATFRAMFAAIPRRIKTLWGWTDQPDQEWVALEYERLADYTRKAESAEAIEQTPNDDDF